MKRLACALALLLLLSACAGVTAREQVLMRAMEMSWTTSIAANVERGAKYNGEVLLESTRMGLALKNRDRGALREIDWHTLMIRALVGISFKEEEQEIGPIVGQIMRDEVSTFDRSYQEAVK